MAGGYCSVCRSGYRGSFAVHTLTKKHRANLGPKLSRAQKRAVKRRLNIGNRPAGYYALRHEEGVGMVEVRRYRRRPPLDGQSRTVQVRPHIRGFPYRGRY